MSKIKCSFSEGSGGLFRIDVGKCHSRCLHGMKKTHIQQYLLQNPQRTVQEVMESKLTDCILLLTFHWVNNSQMIYATMIFISFYRDGVGSSVELVPVHSTNHSATAAPHIVSQVIILYIFLIVPSQFIVVFTFSTADYSFGLLVLISTVR